MITANVWGFPSVVELELQPFPAQTKVNKNYNRSIKQQL